MKTRALSEPERLAILSNFKAVEDWRTIGPFCVDGRDGEVTLVDAPAQQHLFVQALGGSLLMAVIAYLAQAEDKAFTRVWRSTLATMQAAGFGCGVHRGSHADGVVSDCGFADNLADILDVFLTHKNQIARLVNQAAPAALAPKAYRQVLADVKAKPRHDLPAGEVLIQTGLEDGANYQELSGDHAEIAAVVNTQAGSTLDTKALVDAGVQAFNLDLWYVLAQAAQLGLDRDYATAASLGLYVATAMVLVEPGRGVRLPILVR
jgi:hypothetical protein